MMSRRPPPLTHKRAAIPIDTLLLIETTPGSGLGVADIQTIQSSWRYTER